ncbi:alpha-ketoglutarate decarboxylase [Gracilaria domingensis]|nr:alpha-ketoglutarate decarboxylase [Gracilaria domingensis]
MAAAAGGCPRRWRKTRSACDVQRARRRPVRTAHGAADPVDSHVCGARAAAGGALVRFGAGDYHAVAAVARAVCAAVWLQGAVRGAAAAGVAGFDGVAGVPDDERVLRDVRRRQGARGAVEGVRDRPEQQRAGARHC